MTITYHPTVTNSTARTELDELFAQWLDADVTADFYGYENAAANDKAAMASERYEAAKIYWTYTRVAPRQTKRVVAIGDNSGVTKVAPEMEKQK